MMSQSMMERFTVPFFPVGSASDEMVLNRYGTGGNCTLFGGCASRLGRAGVVAFGLHGKTGDCVLCCKMKQIVKEIEFHANVEEKEGIVRDNNSLDCVALRMQR